MNDQDFIIEEKPDLFGRPQPALKKYVGTASKVYVPAEIKSISSFAFDENPYVEQVVLPSELEVIDSCAFSDCKNLYKVNIPDSIRVIVGSAFSGCENLIDVALPDRENFIVERTAFVSCHRLTEYWTKHGLCPLCGNRLTRKLFKKVCNRCHTNIK